MGWPLLQLSRSTLTDYGVAIMRTALAGLSLVVMCSCGSEGPGPLADENPRNHDRYSDEEAVAAVEAAGYVPGPHTEATPRTDEEIVSVVAAAGYVTDQEIVDVVVAAGIGLSPRWIDANGVTVPGILGLLPYPYSQEVYTLLWFDDDGAGWALHPSSSELRTLNRPSALVDYESADCSGQGYFRPTSGAPSEPPNYQFLPGVVGLAGGTIGDPEYYVASRTMAAREITACSTRGSHVCQPRAPCSQGRAQPIDRLDIVGPPVFPYVLPLTPVFFRAP